MYYEHPDMSAEAKVTYLEFLLGLSDGLADTISLASPASRGELVVIAERGREILKHVAHESGPVLIREIHEVVPTIGRSDTKELEDCIEKADHLFIDQHEMELEMNLALFQTILLHGKGYVAFARHRDELIGRAHAKVDPHNLIGFMQFTKRFGAIRYFDAAAMASGLYPELSSDDLAWHIQAGIDAFQRAQNIAHAYSAYDQFMATFNLGRLEFLRGNHRGLARAHLQYAHRLAGSIESEPFQKLARQYLTALDNNAGFGSVIDDPPEFTEQLMELVTIALEPGRHAGAFLSKFARDDGSA